MDQKITECLQGKHDNYILPFLWLHGEPKERLREEILAIKNSGIRAFCAESRPYEDFCREAWWEDFGFLLQTAKELDMQVWLLDDKKFPTGYANGYLEREENAHLRKKRIRELQLDAIGPMRGAKLLVGGRVAEGETILQVIAYRYGESGEVLDYQTATDLTPTLQDGTVYWDVPEGVWRVCVTVETLPFDDPKDRMFYYIDMLNPESCRAMIEAVYEPHYERFAEYFGTTFMGFFSDEPGFLNVSDTYYNRLGQIGQVYPWREDLPAQIAESAGVDEAAVRLWMPALWEDLGEVTSLIRMHYMEVVTKRYRENFSYQLGNWCREHRVMYIGHVIEDMGAHMRLGYGSGHYFRALDGQDMAGIDIVLMQDVPGLSNNIHRAPLADGGAADPAFFRYTLPKLAASHAHIQPLKQGRAMCEIFGAFGWVEGLPFMKGLADSMLASGINYFVPHAFTPRAEDTDCPPHFYNGGKNIQFPHFKHLMDYMGRCSHALSGGTHRADVAVFYNAESEWCGGDGARFFSLCRDLTRSRIDFDILPYDTLAAAEVKDGRLLVNGESYGALIVSESPVMPFDRLACFDGLARGGLPVIVENSLPVASAEGREIGEATAHLEAIPVGELSATLRQRGLCHVDGEGKGLANLRFYHVTREEKDIFLFSNEDIMGEVDARLTLGREGPCLIYDPWDNRCYRTETKDGCLHLRLEKGNMLFAIFGDEIPDGIPALTYETHREELSLQFEIAVREEGEADFRTVEADGALVDLSAPYRMPRLSGDIRYRTVFEAREGYSVLDLGQVGEVAEAWLNGKPLGVRINAPYKFDLSDGMEPGENHLEILVKTNLAHRRRDWFSTFTAIPPSGILGPVALCKYAKND
ncbi:MAG: hypothetical protein J6D21_07230 [Clostridia bacterium]|nr:hypothetical protein [Clostridia bacterium]